MRALGRLPPALSGQRTPPGGPRSALGGQAGRAAQAGAAGSTPPPAPGPGGLCSAALGPPAPRRAFSASETRGSEGKAGGKLGGVGCPRGHGGGLGRGWCRDTAPRSPPPVPLEGAWRAWEEGPRALGRGASIPHPDLVLRREEPGVPALPLPLPPRGAPQGSRWWALTCSSQASGTQNTGCRPRLELARGGGHLGRWNISGITELMRKGL